MRIQLLVFGARKNIFSPFDHLQSNLPFILQSFKRKALLKLSFENSVDQDQTAQKLLSFLIRCTCHNPLALTILQRLHSIFRIFITPYYTSLFWSYKPLYCLTTFADKRLHMPKLMDFTWFCRKSEYKDIFLRHKYRFLAYEVKRYKTGRQSFHLVLSREHAIHTQLFLLSEGIFQKLYAKKLTVNLINMSDKIQAYCENRNISLWDRFFKNYTLKS